MNLDRCTASQRSVVTTLDAPLMVSAGAGSGKTFTLAQRVAYVLAPGDGSEPYLRSVDEVLAITFTKKAAGELKGRIKSLLLAEGLYDEALKVDGAWVSTIHGMASRILREHALEIGIDPAFEVVEGAERDELLALAVERVIAEAEESGDPLLGRLLLNERLGGDGQSGGVMEHAQAILARVYAMPDRFEGLDAACGGASPGTLLRRACAAADAMLAASEAWIKPGKTKLAFVEKLKQARARADEWLAAESGGSFADADFDTEAFCRVFYGFPLTTGAATGKDKPDFDEWQRAMIEVEREVRTGAAASWLLAVVSLARKVDAAFSAIKGPSRLDNNDLLAVCARALREHPAIAERLRRTFKIIMVDEFQDTDRMQVDIIGAIAQPGFANVCTVGDAQQSIYRFRGADVNVFEEYRRDLVARCGEGACESLDWNFRSHGDILAFVERIFFDREVFGDGFLRLEARGAVNEGADPLFEARPRVRVNVVQRAWNGVEPGEALELSARAVADHFAELAEAGARAGDMVLLLGRMTNAHRYAAALRERGLASMIAGGSVFSQMPEPALVSALLRFAVNSRDDEALFQVLASPLFALADDVLLALASRHADDGTIAMQSLGAGFASPTLGEDVLRLGLDERDARLMLEARSALVAFAHRARAGSASAALRELLVASGLLDRLEAGGVEGLSSGGNLAKSLHLVQDMERDCCGIASLAAAFDAHLATAKEAPGALATSEGDFVRIMTVHASKGLEFPHVAVADLKDGREDTGRLVVENIGRATYAAASFLDGEFEKAKGTYERVAAKLEDDPDGGALTAPDGAVDFSALKPGERYAALSEYAEDQALAEARRLLYVALTRASRSLFVALQLRRNLDKGYEGTGVFEDIYRAVPWEASETFAVDRIGYGGSAPAEVQFRFLAAAGDEASEGAAELTGGEGVPGGDGAGAAGGLDAAAPSEEVAEEAGCGESALSGAVPPFAITRREALPRPVAVPCNFARAGLFSYTSLSGAHPHSDEAAIEDDEGAVAVREDRAERAGAFSSSAGREGSVQPGEVGSQREGYAEGKEGDAPAPPSESATALGTAFHRLAQQAIELSESGALFCPGEAAMAAQIQKEQLSEGQQGRLRTALDRWLASDEAARFASFANRRAEVPFTVRIPAQDVVLSGARSAESKDPAGVIPSERSEPRDLGETFFLEGEIDGLADNGDGAAFLIDYKTGGTAEETPEQLDAKHRLQASCYAYALLRSGYTSVEAHFLRIEHVSAENPRDPQIVPYYFEASDLPALEALIIAKQKEATA